MHDPWIRDVRAFDRTLRRIERIGQLCLTLWIAVMIVLGAMWPDPYKMTWEMLLAQMVAGRAASVAVGMTRGFPQLFLLLHCTMIDIIMLLLLYPIMVAGYRRAIEWRFVGPTIANIRATAEKHKSKVEPFGALGLAAFVFFPFWSTGALAGGLVGYLLGMRTRVVFSSIIIGEVIAVATWIWFWERMNKFTAALGNYPVTILVSVIVAAGILRVVQLRRRARERRLNGNGAAAASPESDTPPAVREE